MERKKAVKAQNDQWQRQHDSLIALTKCLLLIRSLSKISLCDDAEINHSRLVSAMNKIQELADSAHNLPTAISNSMMHFVTLENGHPTEDGLAEFNRNFERELTLLTRQLEDNAP
ncbi:hypothetical protein [Acinetobacter sp. Leaf130]|uniref:hypothetical protein n=1 Tax=Acinetobacter sp. Leaf130 TaxID=1736269 RepID=UPI0006F7EEE2|nr:hypothetical protein [Acinetobacter sp. Leaf130]KQQ65461.1 hypothetical protein ASF86_18450 [Acinetobacter sp. Leaf130]